MMNPNDFFKGKEENLKGLLTNDNYQFTVPDYQRKYAWTENELSQFWNDYLKTISQCYSEDFKFEKSTAEPHFLGAIVLTKSSEHSYEITDGQQRLTTITIFVSTLLEIIEQLTSTQDKSGLTNRILPLIHKHDYGDQFEARLKLDDTINYFFQKFIVECSIPSKKLEYINNYKPLKNSSEQRIVDAYNFFKNNLKKSFPDTLTQEEFYDKLLCYTNVLTRNLLVLKLSIFKKEIAYMIFETLNKRGKDLSESDMIKNELFKSVAEKNRSSIKDMWDKISDNIENENLTEYIRFHYASHFNNVSPTKLYEVIKNHIEDNDTLSYLNSLVEESKPFARVTLVDTSWSKEIIPMLKSFKEMDITHCYPLLLSGAIVYCNNPDEFKRLVKNTITFCFRFFTIGKEPVSSLENEIGFMARILRNFETTIKYNKAEYCFYSLDDLINYMKNLTDDSIFEKKFINFSTKSNQLAFYIINNLEKELATGVVPLPHGPGQHVEHIMPKTPSFAKARINEWNPCKHDPNYKEYIFRLGNLLILESNINQEIKNKDYNVKKLGYKKSGLYYPKQIELNYSKWEFSDIECRQAQMSKLALKAWCYI